MVKINRLNLRMVYDIGLQQSATQGSNDTTHRLCHAGQQQPGLAHCQKQMHQGFANIRSGGLLPRKHSPDGATWAHIQ